MKDEIELFKVVNPKEFRIADFDPGFTGKYKKDDAEAILNELRGEMSELQEKLYAANKYSVLIIFQAMDAAGKDSAIKHTMSGLNPQGCQVFSFKQPSAEELDHDFLWRHAKALPERGRIGIHNRSHYENVIVCKVHPEYILNENIASVDSVENIDSKFWDARYESIRSFEKHIHDNGTVIIKFFLNVSKEEQKERFLERIDDSAKYWKFSSGDIEERKKWNDYMDVYEQAIKETSVEQAPWYVIPADKKWFTRIAVSKVIINTLKELKLSVPELSDEEKGMLDKCRTELMNEK
ncbi:MAG: polyphosphate kinase 2 family protein [Daejeonella sp.]|uniref:polyphosphate kinase 2 family protein n=1 Tax=Daejeonella sp. JGW-45 TaxID=3034148 RepID=UPI0023EE1F26|nr:polyphosphate kinase 2 family protein [Daejeonella sp. JGW-45]